MSNQSISREIKIGGLTAFAIYFGIGALAHLVFIGGAIDWSSAWTYAVVLAWPLFASLAVFAIMAVVALVCFLVIGITHYFEVRGRRVSAEQRKAERDAKLAAIREDRAQRDGHTLN